jgi:centromeric protein E
MKLEEKLLEREADSRHEEQMLEIQLARTALKERIEHLNRLILCSKSTGVNTSGAILGRISGLSAGANEPGIKSLRSSASQSTLGAVGPSLNRSASMVSVRSGGAVHSGRLTQSPFGNHEEEEDTMGEFGDGVASLQMQINALQADLADKNRYIATLERRLLQARRSSHSRMSMGISHLKGTGMSADDPEIMAMLRDKDMEISELRIQLDDKDRMVAALRSAARQRDVAQLTPDSIPPEIKHASAHQSNGSNSSSPASGAALGGVSPVTLLSPLKIVEKEKEKKRRSVDEMSRMLDEMIQDRVESGHLIKGSRGSMRLASGGLRESSSGANIPALGTMVEALRGSATDVTSG